MIVNQTYDDLPKIAKICVDTVRFLAVDAIQKAGSGHPGMPMGIAGPAFRLFTKHLRHNPRNPSWPNRDRFVLSAGHGSALLYSLLHLSGYDLSLDEIKNFRQWGSRTPGHPEYGLTPGVETTTGPLGQGLSTAVGMAIAEKYLAEYFNKERFPLIDYKVYVLAGDGCMQEGVSHEACSLAGHLGLDNLIVIYDDNKITIDGRTDISFTENTTKRLEACGWFVQEIPGDGHNLEAFDQAIEKAAQQQKRPSLIKVRTTIGFGSPNMSDTSKVHGSPLGEEEIKLTKRTLGWTGEQKFHIPREAKEYFQQQAEIGEQAEADWNQLLDNYKKSNAQKAEEFQKALNGEPAADWERYQPRFEAGSSVATRVASGKFLEKVMPHSPLIMGGSADLTPSNNTFFPGATAFQKDNPGGRYLYFGVREHAMGAILSGINLSGIARAYGATFLCFADYMLPAIRVAALSKIPNIYIFTHDSIGLGEDGPTHQPVEQISYLRALPGLVSFRPADANETVEVWKFALKQKNTPVAVALSRQALPVLDQSKFGSAKLASKGGYALTDEKNPEALLVATGSEVHTALQAREQLAAEGIKARVISMPSRELFESQPQEYRDKILPKNVKNRVVIEAGIKNGWEGYSGESGTFIGMKSFGASAPAKDLFRNFGITAENIVKAVKKNTQP